MEGSGCEFVFFALDPIFFFARVSQVTTFNEPANPNRKKIHRGGLEKGSVGQVSCATALRAATDSSEAQWCTRALLSGRHTPSSGGLAAVQG